MVSESDERPRALAAMSAVIAMRGGEDGELAEKCKWDKVFASEDLVIRDFYAPGAVGFHDGRTSVYDHEVNVLSFDKVSKKVTWYKPGKWEDTLRSIYLRQIVELVGQAR